MFYAYQLSFQQPIIPLGFSITTSDTNDMFYSVTPALIISQPNMTKTTALQMTDDRI